MSKILLKILDFIRVVPNVESFSIANWKIVDASVVEIVLDVVNATPRHLPNKSVHKTEPTIVYNQLR